MAQQKKGAHIRNNEEIKGVAADAVLMCEKQRNGEHEEQYQLWYHKDSQQFVDSEDAVPMAFDTVGAF